MFENYLLSPGPPAYFSVRPQSTNVHAVRPATCLGSQTLNPDRCSTFPGFCVIQTARSLEFIGSEVIAICVCARYHAFAGSYLFNSRPYYWVERMRLWVMVSSLACLLNITHTIPVSYTGNMNTRTYTLYIYAHSMV